MRENLQVVLRPWAAGDLELLERLMGDPRMTEHFGGPETPGRPMRANDWVVPARRS